ncbi:hypothetical protein COLO4_04950 [Corchorus olitorius]|uniref:Uncharacterized protein n=1 Tax=Corchorus olitorius TaxID=93759 RepID=A0A1R3KSD4_9ROSI|nr:hypothetical protein COLO4_04950 [Corchorus olitorius]
MLEKVGWIRLTKFSNEKASLTAAKEFYTGIVTKANLYHGDKLWNQEDIFAFFCGKEVVVTANMLADRKKNFSDYQAKRKLLNVQAKLIHHFIVTCLWYKQGSLEYVNHKDDWLLHNILTGTKVNLAQIIINEMKRTASKKDSLHYISQHRFVQTTVKDSQIAQALESLTNAITVINTNINQMRKSNLKDQQSTQKILSRMADKILGESLENEDQLEESDETPPEEEQLRKEYENVVEREEDNEDKGEKKDEGGNENINVEVQNEEEQEKEKGLEDVAEEELNQEGEDGISETNVSKASSETNSEEGDLTLATTEEVIAGLEPLAIAPASPKGKGKAKPSSHSISSPTKRVIKPKKKVTKKAITATDKAPAHATESDVISEATKIPLAVPLKRPRTKHPNVDASETIPAAASKLAKIRHIFRKGNRCVDRLVMLAHEAQRGLSVCSEPPEQIITLLNEDQLRIDTLRP